MPSSARGLHSGFTLVELMVAVALGMLLTSAMVYVYITSKAAFSRQQQVSSIQQSVRMAFDFLGSDTRMVGHLGCYTGSPVVAPTFNSDLGAINITNNFVNGVEGYEATATTVGQLTLGSSKPADISDATKWETNVAVGVTTLPLSTVAGAGNGLTPGSDVLVLRSVTGRPVRLNAIANTGSGQATLSIESNAGDSATCADGSTSKVSGLCAPSGTYTGSYGLLASCKQARLFRVASIAGNSPSTVTLATSMGTDPVYDPASTEVFPLQTSVYYVKLSSKGDSTSLYRRVFDGTQSAGVEQELIEGVESMQVTYGIDTTSVADGVVDAYVAAKGTTSTASDSVVDWSRVVAVRVGLLVRSTTPLDADLGTVVGTSGQVNDVLVTYPTSGTKFDRRVFTTTIAVRNKITYFTSP